MRQKTRVLNENGSARLILPPARVGMHQMLDLDLVQPISYCISNCLHDRSALLSMSDGLLTRAPSQVSSSPFFQFSGR